jgi:hypothetical protein
MVYTLEAQIFQWSSINVLWLEKHHKTPSVDHPNVVLCMVFGGGGAAGNWYGGCV